MAARYDAFISYSHAADGQLAPALQAALHRLGKPWHALRALRVFRDETSLAATPQLWPAIQRAMASSRHLIYMASPEAAASPWVGQELTWWRQHRPDAPIFIALTDGELVWNAEAHDFDAQRSTAIHAALLGSYDVEPKFVDLRWARPESGLTIAHARFRAAALDLAAPLHGLDKDVLDGEDVRRQRQARRWASGAIVSLAALSMLASAAAWLATTQRREAVHQRQLATARQLAAQSQLLNEERADQGELAALLAVRAHRLTDSFETRRALRSAVQMLPVPLKDWRASFELRGRVRALRFSDDGRWLAIGREDATLEVVDSAKRETVVRLTHADTAPLPPLPASQAVTLAANGVDAEVVEVAFSHDGSAVASAGRDGLAHVWSLPGGQARLSIDHGAPLRSVAIDPSGQWLATAGDDNAARLWRMDATGAAEPAMALEASDRFVKVAFQPGGGLLAALSVEGCVHLAAVPPAPSAPARKHCLRRITLDMAFSPDGRLLALAAESDVVVLRTDDGQPVMQSAIVQAAAANRPAHWRWVDTLAFSADGRLLAAGARDGTARVWSVANGQEVARVKHRAGVALVAFSPDGQTLVTAAGDGAAHAWRVADGEVLARQVHAPEGTAVAVHPSGDWIASGGGDGRVVAWRPGRGDVVLRQSLGARVEVVGVSPDGSRLLAAGSSAVKAWSAQDGSDLGQVKTNRRFKQFSFSADGSSVFAADSTLALFRMSPRLQQLEVPQPRHLHDIRLGEAHAVAIDTAGRKLLAWDRTGRQFALAPDSGMAIHDPVISADGLRVAALHLDQQGKGTLRVHALPSFQPLASVPVDHQAALALDASGSRLAVARRTPKAAAESASTSHAASPPIERWTLSVDIVDASTGKKLSSVSDDRDLFGLQFSADGERLVVSGTDHRTRRTARLLWSWQRNALLGRVDEDASGQLGRGMLPRTGSTLVVAKAQSTQVLDEKSLQLVDQVDHPEGAAAAAVSPDGRLLLTGNDAGQVTLWRLAPSDLIAEICRRVTVDLSDAQRAHYLGNAAGRSTCATAEVGR